MKTKIFLLSLCAIAFLTMPYVIAYFDTVEIWYSLPTKILGLAIWVIAVFGSVLIILRGTKE